MNCKSRFPNLAQLHREFPGWLIMLRHDAWMFVAKAEIRRAPGRRMHRLIRKHNAMAHDGGWKEFITMELETAKALSASDDISI